MRNIQRYWPDIDRRLSRLAVYVILRLFLRTLPSRIRGRKIVLVLKRQHFEKDVAQLKMGKPNVDWVTLRVYQIAGPQLDFTPKILQTQTECADSWGKINYSWRKNETFFNYLISAAGGDRLVVGVLDANFDYWQSHALARVCRKRLIPFYVLMRENYVSPISRKNFRERYAGYKAEVHAIAVASEVQKDLIVGENIVPSKRVWVTGYPRNDPALRAFTDPNSGQARIAATFLGFDGPRYGNLSAEHYEETLRVFIESSISLSGVSKIYVKCKSLGSVGLHKAIAKDSKSSKLQIEVSHKRPIPEILAESRVVVGGNSQSTIEALLSPVPVVFPMLGVDPQSPFAIFESYDTLEEAFFFVSRTTEEFRHHLHVASKLSASSALASTDVLMARRSILGRNISFSMSASSTDKVLEMMGANSW